MAALNVTVARYATMGSNHGSDDDGNDDNPHPLILPIHGDSVERVVARGRYAAACFNGQHSPIAVWAANAEAAECAETVAATAAASETSTAITPTVLLLHPPMTHGGPVDDAGCRFLSSAMHVVPVQTVDVASVRGTSISSGTGKAERSPPSQTSPPSSSTRPHVFTVTASGMCTLWDALDARCVDTLSLHNDSALFAQLPVVLRTLPLRVCASVVVAGASGRSSLSPSSTTTMKTAFGSGTGSASPAHVLLALALDTVLVVRVGTTPMQVAGVLRGLTTAHGDAGIRALNVWSPTGNACAPKLVIMDGHGSLYIWLWSIVDATVIGRRPLAVVPSDVHDSANASAATSFAVNVHNNSLQVALIHHDHIRVLLLPLDLSAEDELLHEALESMGSGSPPSFHHTATFAQAATTLVELRVPAGQRGTITGCSFTAVTSITAWTADGQWFRWHLDGTLQDCSSMIPTNRPRTSQMTAFASDRGMLHTVALRRGVMTYSACDVVRSDEAVLQTSHAITFGRKSTVTAMAVLDDRYVAWGKNDGAIDITDLTAYFDSTETAPLHTFRFHRGPITCLHVPHMGVSESQTSGTEASAADDNKGRSVTAKHWLMSGGADGCVCLWDLETLTLLHAFHAHTAPLTTIFQPPPEFFYTHIRQVARENNGQLTEPMSPATPRSTIKSRPPFAFPFKRRDHVHRASGSVDSVLSVTSTVGVYSPLIRLLKSAVYTVASDHSLAILSLDDLTCRYVLGTMTARIEWVQWVLDDGVLVVGSGDGLAQRWRLSGGSGALEEYGAVPYPGNSGGAALVDNIDASAIRPSLWLADWLDIRTQQQQQCAVFAASMSSTPMITVNIKRLLTLVDHEIALDTHEDTAHDYIHASDKSTATVIAHVVRQVCGLLFPWRVDATLDKLADDAKLMRYGVGHGATTVLVMRGVQQQLGCVLPHVAKGQQWIANIQSPQASALRLCTLMALLKKLLVATKSDPQPIQALIDTMPHTVSQLLTTSAMQPPALSFLAKFNNDPSTQHISEIQSSAHDLFAITLKHTPPAHLHLLVAFWYNRLPSVNFDIRMLKAMVRACATLGALAEEELSYANHGVSLADCVVIHHDAAPDASVTAGTHVVLGSAIKEEISKSIAILLTTNIDDKDQAAKLCAVNLLGSGWPLWQDVLANMPMSVVLQISEPSMASKVHQYHRQHSGISLGIPSEPNHPHAHLPVNVVILRTLMRFAVMSSKSQQQKDQQLPDNKPVYKTNVARRLRRLRIGAKHVNEAFVVEVDGKNSAERTAFNNLDIPSSALDPTMISLNNAATDARGRGSDKPGIPYRSRSLPRLQQSVLPLEEPIDAELQREFTKILSLPQIARQALMNVAAASWTMFFAIVCAELVMAGIKEGDWERVRTAMRAGVVLTTRMRPDLLFPHSLAKLLEAIIRGALDPNIPFQVRDKLNPTVTSVLQELIKTFPTLTFHPASQRLAIASGYATTTETSVSSPAGAVVVWDLRTASRLHVIDAHRGHHVTAIAYSKPSGDSEASQLATYSHEEGVLKVWQVQTSLFGSLASTFGMTGALTRQESTSGGDGSVLSNLAGGMRVVKSFPVERSNAAPSAQDWQSILRHVKLEWTGASTILLRRLPPQPPLTFQL